MILVWALALVALTLAAAMQYQRTHFLTEAPEGVRTTIRVGEETIMAEVADTPALQTQGLSGRTSLKEGEGMIFIFEEEGVHGMWMKDMLFSIDIIWAGTNGTVITIEENVSPDTYPEAFYADTPTALYVLEVPAGFVSRTGVAVGDKIVVQ